MKNKEQYIESLLSELSLDEKIGMIHGAGLFRTEGVERLGIPPLRMSDGPMGVRSEFKDNCWEAAGTTEDYVSYLPSNSAIASTWNREVAKKSGYVLGREARGRRKDIILAPGINIKRSPLCGRNFEYMSEDPYLTGEMAVPYVEGVQESDVAACVKHFVANNQETDRLIVDTLVDERTLQEIYYPGFKAVLANGCRSLMSAYNLLNGEQCSESQTLLNKVLRKEWGYDGMVVCDWGAIHNTKDAAEAAVDIEMSVTYDFDDYKLASPLKKAVENGEISEQYIDDKVRNILRLMLHLRMIGEEKEERASGTYAERSHWPLLLEAAQESLILLKNEDKKLPLSRKGLKKVGVIGLNAETNHALGGGSAEIKAIYEVSPLLGIMKLLGGNTEVCYAKGYCKNVEATESSTNWQESSLETQDEESGTSMDFAQERRNAKLDEDAKAALERKRAALKEEALALAKECDEVIYIGGMDHDYDVEGLDRPDMKLPYEQDSLIQELLEVKPDMVIVMYAGSPVNMTAWNEKAKAIVWSYYAGMEGGSAIADVLFGNVNPSGKLAETFVRNEKDTYPYILNEFAKKGSVNYKDGILVGYRYYDTKQVEPLYCFGHGLSYTTFAYSNLQVKVTEEKDAKVEVTVQVKNTGDVKGKEIVQLYLSDVEAGVMRPVQELKQFEKISLEPGEEKTVTMLLTGEAFAYYAEKEQCFKTEAGAYEIRVGASSRDIRCTEKITLKKEYRYDKSVQKKLMTE